MQINSPTILQTIKDRNIITLDRELHVLKILSSKNSNLRITLYQLPFSLRKATVAKTKVKF